MAIRAVSYLKQNRFGVYYFRRVIPPDVRRFFAVGEVARSTGTGSRREAVTCARRMAVAVEAVFDRLREMAKKKNNNGDAVAAGLIVKFDFEADGTLKSLVTDAKPEEVEAAGRLVPQLLQVARARATVDQPGTIVDGPRLFDEIEKYLDEQTRGGTWLLGDGHLAPVYVDSGLLRIELPGACGKRRASHRDFRRQH